MLSIFAFHAFNIVIKKPLSTKNIDARNTQKIELEKIEFELNSFSKNF